MAQDSFDKLLAANPDDYGNERATPIEPASERATPAEAPAGTDFSKLEAVNADDYPEEEPSFLNRVAERLPTVGEALYAASPIAAAETAGRTFNVEFGKLMGLSGLPSRIEQATGFGGLRESAEFLTAQPPSTLERRYNVDIAQAMGTPLADPETLRDEVKSAVIDWFSAGKKGREKSMARRDPVNLAIANVVAPLAEFANSIATGDGAAMMLASMNLTGARIVGGAIIEPMLNMTWDGVAKAYEKVAKEGDIPAAFEGATEAGVGVLGVFGAAKGMKRPLDAATAKARAMQEFLVADDPPVLTPRVRTFVPEGKGMAAFSYEPAPEPFGLRSKITPKKTVTALRKTVTEAPRAASEIELVEGTGPVFSEAAPWSFRVKETPDVLEQKRLSLLQQKVGRLSLEQLPHEKTVETAETTTTRAREIERTAAEYPQYYRALAESNKELANEASPQGERVGLSENATATIEVKATQVKGKGAATLREYIEDRATTEIDTGIDMVTNPALARDIGGFMGKWFKNTLRVADEADKFSPEIGDNVRRLRDRTIEAANVSKRRVTEMQETNRDYRKTLKANVRFGKRKQANANLFLWQEGKINDAQLRLRLGREAADALKPKMKALRGTLDELFAQTNKLRVEQGLEAVPEIENAQNYFHRIFRVGGMGLWDVLTKDFDVNPVERPFSEYAASSKYPRLNSLLHRSNMAGYILDPIRAADAYITSHVYAQEFMPIAKQYGRFKNAVAEAMLKTGDGKGLVEWLENQSEILMGKNDKFDQSVTKRVLGQRGKMLLRYVNHRTSLWFLGATAGLTLPVQLASTFVALAKGPRGIPAGVVRTIASIPDIVMDAPSKAWERSPWVRAQFERAKPAAPTFGQTAENIGFRLFGIFERTAKEGGWNILYSDGLRKFGGNVEKAARYADEWGSRTMGERLQGIEPQAFGNIVFDTALKFFAEPANTVQLLGHDFGLSPSRLINLIKRGRWEQPEVFEAMKYFAASYAFNTMVQYFGGYRPTLDPIGAFQTAFHEPDEPDEKLKFYKRTTGQKLFQAAAMMATNIPVLSQGMGLAFGPEEMRKYTGQSQTWLGGQGLPQASMIRQVLKEPTLAPFLFSPAGGGAQAARAMKGTRLLRNYRGPKMTAGEKLQTIVMGPQATGKGRGAYNKLLLRERQQRNAERTEAGSKRMREARRQKGSLW